METISALMIEDSLGDGHYISQIIQEEEKIKITVEQTFRLSSGLDRLSKNKYDVILLDLSLPDSTGLSTLTRLLQDARNVPVVVMTGLEDEELALKAVKLGAQDYLIKYQIDCRTLVRSICYAIARQNTSKISAETCL
jgi:DNA-binding NarL/FixJ family response regulator